MEKKQTADIQQMVGELASHARMLEEILAASADHIYMYDASGRYLYVNPSGAAAIGLKHYDMIGKYWRELSFPAEIMEPFDVQRCSVMETGNPVIDETLFPTIEGPRNYEYILTPVFGEDKRVKSVVCNVRDVTERKKKESRFQRTEDIMRVLSLQFMNAQEEERRHIARELHDEIGQMLSIIKVNLQQFRRTPDPDSHVALLDKSIEAVGQTLEQIRRLSHDLRPSILDDLGLAAALRWFIDYRLKDTGITHQFLSETSGTRLPADMETACFRVVQEALTNAIRHAGAGRINIDLRQTPEEIRLVIRDDGKGFNLRTVREEALRGSHLGLLGMQQRILAAGGKIRIDTEPGNGCCIEISFSLHLNKSLRHQIEKTII